jgi:hypothetical protein
MTLEESFNSIQNGFFYMKEGATSAPKTTGRFLCLSFNAGTTYYRRQIAFADNDNYIYSRQYDGATKKWGSWETIKS